MDVRGYGGWWTLCITGWIGLAACDAGCRATDVTPPTSTDRTTRVEQRTLEVSPHEGLSGLTVADGVSFWTMPERQRVLLPLALVGDGLTTAGAAIPIRGVPPGVDTEAITWIGDHDFLVGTESQSGRSHEALLRIEVTGSGTERRAEVQETLALPYALWGLQAEANRGIEGLCHVEGRLVVALELVRVHDGQRHAPLAVLDLAERRWLPLWLTLTSDTGKISALDCRPGGREGGIEVLAVERHFGVSRVLHFRLPGTDQALPPQTQLAAEVMVDLASHIDPLPNFEGLVWHGPNVLLVSDNHYGKRTGPTVTVKLSLDSTP